MKDTVSRPSPQSHFDADVMARLKAIKEQSRCGSEDIDWSLVREKLELAALARDQGIKAFGDGPSRTEMIRWQGRRIQLAQKFLDALREEPPTFAFADGCNWTIGSELPALRHRSLIAAVEKYRDEASAQVRELEQLDRPQALTTADHDACFIGLALEVARDLFGPATGDEDSPRLCFVQTAAQHLGIQISRDALRMRARRQ